MIARILHIILTISLFILTLGVSPAGSIPTIPVEYQVKAAFIDNFIKFIDWPDGSLAGNSMVIGIFGDTPLADAFQSVEDLQIKGYRVSVRIIKSFQDLGNANILFIASSEARRVGEILRAVKKRGVLTIGEVEGFCRKGGMINFVLSENKVRFEINANSAKDAGLVISSKLLKLATIVQTDQEGN